MRGFEQIPWLYDALCAVFDWSGLRKWRLWLTSGARGRTLEVGCGTGRNLPLYPGHINPIGVDPSLDSLHAARRKSPLTPLVRAHAEALPFRNGAFETVVSSLVFCSVSQPETGLSELKRVMTDDGQLRMMEHVRAEGFKGRIQDFIQPAWTLVAGGCHPNRRTEAAVEAAGFLIDADGRRSRDNLRRFSARKS